MVKMKQNESDKKTVKKVIIFGAGAFLLAFFMLIISALDGSRALAAAAAAGEPPVWANITGLLYHLGIVDEFTRAVSMGIDPLITLLAVSIQGGASTWAIVVLAIVIISKIALNSFRGSKVVCDAFLGQAEDVIGLAAVLIVGFLNTPPLVSAYASASGGAISNAALGASSILVSLGGSAIYYAVRVLVRGVDAIGYLYALIPGGFAISQWVRQALAAIYVFITIALPYVAAAIGFIILIIAIILFGKSFRLQKYFRSIYIYPFLRGVFKRGESPPLIISRPYRYLVERFPGMKLCQEAFALKGIGSLKKRQRVFLVACDDRTYLCRKPFLRSWEVIDFPMDELYAAQRMRFMQIYSRDGGSMRPKVSLVLRRELNKRYEEIRSICGFQIPPEKADSKKYKLLSSYSTDVISDFVQREL